MIRAGALRKVLAAVLAVMGFVVFLSGWLWFYAAVSLKSHLYAVLLAGTGIVLLWLSHVTYAPMLRYLPRLFRLSKPPDSAAVNDKGEKGPSST